MAWQLHMTIRLPPDFDVLSTHQCRQATMQYCKTEQIMCRIRAGGAGFFPAGEGTIFYCYCVQHKDCKFSWKHLFAGGDHAIFTKGVHCEIDRWLAHLQALDGRNGWSIGSQPNGACALLHESFARDAATLIAQSSDICPIVAVQDVTYAVFNRDWGLYRCAIASKHFDEEGIPRTSLHTLSLGVVETENEEDLRAVLQFTCQWHAARGNQLAQVIHQIHGHQGPGVTAAARSIFPKAVFRLDQRHQLASMMRHACGAVASRKLACAVLQFGLLSLHWCDGLWHLCIDALLQRLVEQGEVDYAEYLRQHVFTLEEQENQKIWTSLCRNRISLLKNTVQFQTTDAAWTPLLLSCLSSSVFWLAFLTSSIFVFMLL